jgi:SWI/SNF-related matrix-associated actin-dependent regulator 1 of chromatin subfamily A
MPVIKEWVESRVAEGRKVVIAAHHRDVVDELALAFGNLRIQGGMDINEIEAQKHKFMTLPCEEAPVMVLSIQAAKTGHNLQVAQDVLFVELPWTPADIDQTYSRCHRLGQKSSVTATYLLCDGTIDEDIYSLIERKRGVVNQAVDGGSPDDDSEGLGQLLFGLMGMNEIN